MRGQDLRVTGSNDWLTHRRPGAGTLLVRMQRHKANQVTLTLTTCKYWYLEK